MCWSLEVSIVAGIYGAAVSAYLHQRAYSYRDSWYGLFLLSFTLTQFLDAFFWWYKGEKGQVPCDSVNLYFTKVVVSAAIFFQVFVLTWFPSSRFPTLRKWYRVLPAVGAGVCAVFGKCTFAWTTEHGLLRLPTLVYWGFHDGFGTPGVPLYLMLAGVAMWSIAALAFVTPWWAATNILMVGGVNLVLLTIIDGTILLVSKLCFYCLLLSLLWLSEPLWAPSGPAPAEQKAVPSVDAEAGCPPTAD
eukprot:TRINITY_DN19331_c0_g1_i1.p1 TRINITY_DN19331_c0_g1~~TRINITY_DN19331_c0_g1_i1.p1  ORF type:complete len:270 (+),score=91.53 TRINITY_DN19331_c0_g1_i1:73-810(+)